MVKHLTRKVYANPLDTFKIDIYFKLGFGKELKFSVYTKINNILMQENLIHLEKMSHFSFTSQTKNGNGRTKELSARLKMEDR